MWGPVHGGGGCRSAGGSSRCGSLSDDPLHTSLLCRLRDGCCGTIVIRFLGFPQSPQTLHVLTQFDGPPLDIRHRLSAFFSRQALPLGARGAGGGGLS